MVGISIHKMRYLPNGREIGDCDNISWTFFKKKNRQWKGVPFFQVKVYERDIYGDNKKKPDKQSLKNSHKMRINISV